MAAKSDITLSELRKRLKRHGVAVAIGTLSRFFKHARSRAKKTAQAAEQRSERGARRLLKGQLDLDPTRIVFIDETAANTKMARLYGRAPRASDGAPPCPMATGKPPPSLPTSGERSDRRPDRGRLFVRDQHAPGASRPWRRYSAARWGRTRSAECGAKPKATGTSETPDGLPTSRLSG